MKDQNNPSRRFHVKVRPYLNYPEIAFFMAREITDEHGRTLDRYFFDFPSIETACTIEEARTVIARFKKQYAFLFYEAGKSEAPASCNTELAKQHISNLVNERVNKDIKRVETILHEFKKLKVK